MLTLDSTNFNIMSLKLNNNHVTLLPWKFRMMGWEMVEKGGWDAGWDVGWDAGCGGDGGYKVKRVVVKKVGCGRDCTAQKLVIIYT